MTLGRLIELYQAEQQGKQIMLRVHRSGFFEYIEEVKITECELKDLVTDEITYFIKDEEDEFGYKLS